MTAEYGPFNDERSAMSTRAATRIRAAFDAAPGVGAGVPEALRVMTDEAGACGVELGALDLITLKGIAWRETYETVCVAGMIRRAFEAGKAAALAGGETEWGIRFPVGRPEERVRNFGSEDGEQAARMLLPDYRTTYGDKPEAQLVRRVIGPWTPVPGEEEGNG